MQQHRKAIAAGSGVLLIALLEYATTSADVERSLEAVVPSPWARLVPVVFGGLATVAAVWKASNTPASDDADTVETPAPAAAVEAGTPADARTGESVPPASASMPASAAATPPDAPPPTAEAGATILDLLRSPAPVPHREPAPTSLVQLAPAPARGFQ